MKKGEGEVVTGWKETTLGAEVDMLTGFPFASSGYVDSENAIRLVRGDNIIQGAMRWDGVKKWPQTDISQFNKFQLQADDIVLAMDRPWIEAGLKYSAISKYDLPCLLVQRTARLRGGSNLDTRFLRYLIGSKEFTQHVQAITTGTAVPHISATQIKQFQFLRPPLPEQKSIAAVLSSFDDKIDLLHRQNATLEAMAEALFRQWFVVEAKEGWEEKKLGEFFPVKTGKKDANYSVEDGAYPFFTCSRQTLNAPDYSFEGAAILLAGNGDFNVKRYSGKFEAYQRTYVLIPYNEMYFNFLYVVIKLFLNEITEGHRGSVINFITKGMIEDFIVAMPSGDITPKLRHFNQIYAKVDENTHQIHTLEKLRDTLLPKLMTGEIKIA